MDANALQFTCNTCLENDREEMTPCHTGVSSPHSNWNISDNDSEQKNLVMSRQMRRQCSTDEPKADSSVEKISKMSAKHARGNKLIASSPHSNWNISDNDSEQEYLAMSRQMKRQSSTDEPKAFLGGFFVVMLRYTIFETFTLSVKLT
jgi:hypothetical protein